MARKNDWAEKAARAIWVDCQDRRGIKWALQDVPNRVKWDQILPKWAKLIREAKVAEHVAER